jgi:tripartite-type tricarboxylate transporter receptor subunit TctC
MTVRSKLVSALGALGLALAAANFAHAQPYPSKPIKLIVPFAAGSQPDVMARLVAQHLSSSLGPVVVENRQGAGGTLGAKVVAGAEPDGYTLLLGTTGVLAISPAFFKDAGYDPTKSFAPVAAISNAPFVLVVAPDVPAGSVADLVAYAKANPGKLNYGAATATPPHLACELFRQATSIDIVRIPYTGNPVTGLLSGQTQIMCEASTILLPYIQAGKLRPLAVLSDKRWRDLPDVPTSVESGLPNLLVTVWAGVVVPVGTPEGIVGKLNQHINEGLKSAALAESLAKLGAEPRAGSPQEFMELISAEARRWADMVQQSGVKP